MNFDPRTKAREEEEDNEEKLKLYAIICASLDAHPDNTTPAISIAFQSVWDDAMELESAVKFYRRIDKAKEILGFSK